MNVEHVIKLRVRGNRSIVFEVIGKDKLKYEGRKFLMFKKSQKLVGNCIHTGRFVSENFSY